MKTRYKVLIVLVAVVGLLGAAAMVTLIVLSIDEPPPDVADLEVHRVDVADEENGYTYLREAGKVLWWPGYESGAAYADAGFPEEPEREEDPAETEKAERLENIAAGEAWDGALVDEVLAHNAETFALIEKALACQHFQVPPVLSMDTEVPEVFDWISLMKLQVVRTRALFKRGCEKQAFDEALSIVRMGHTIQGAKGGLIHYRVGQMVKLRGLEVMRQMLQATVLDPEQLKACAESLVSHDVNVDGLTDAFRVEYAVTVNVLEDRFRTLISNARSNYGGIERLERPADLLIPSLDTMGVAKCEESVDVAATRVLLVMKAFKVEKGRLPKTLDELVPEYLDAVPLDDFDGKPLRYSAGKKVIYSVGKDLKDDGGMTKEEQKAWWIEEHPYWNEEEYGEPDIWQMPDPSFAIEF